MVQTATTSDMTKAYDPQSVEQRVYDSWVKGGYFTPVIDRSKKPYVVIMPPPNVTGELHMGHALTKALEDLMVRWHRMIGDPTLYLPGTDHAGIATQVVVERQLASDDKTRHDIGRDVFVDLVWEWVDQYGDRIYEQVKRLGASCDWTRRSFTLDEGPSKAVRTTFVNLYREGLIYRGERIVNWCPRCSTALSDLEVKHSDESAALYHLRYRLQDSDDHLTIATTRPETLLGDTAVAVNPNDDRYSHLVGRSAVLPVLGRVLPVIADETVDPEFGTGALKVTPGHDHNDFEIGRRHGLDTVNVMNLDGTMNENAGPYEGKDRLAVRTEIVEDLERDGLLEKVDPYSHAVGHCDRCDEVVEPIVSKQWYMRMAADCGASHRGRSERRDQDRPGALLQGLLQLDGEHPRLVHQPPALVGAPDPRLVLRRLRRDHGRPRLTRTRARSAAPPSLTRDPDVLDTWFSSALWPHSTLGWPDDTEDLDYFYPGSDMETGHDILFFWVARMIMMGLKNTSEIPFDTVYLHGLIRDPEGVKMSKSKGNVMDPLELIDMYGADALRFALTSGNSPGNDMRLNEQKMEASRNFANKLWNASRFVIGNVDRAGGASGWQWPPAPEHVEDRWILSRLNRVAGQVQTHMEEYQFGEAQRVVHDFLWGEYCDWYLETAKIRIREGDETPLPVLAYVLERLLRLLHPFMPFITEEVWQNLVQRISRTRPAGRTP